MSGKSKELVAEMTTLMSEIEQERSKLFDNNVKASAARLRNKLQRVKIICLQLRKDASEYKNSIDAKKK